MKELPSLIAIDHIALLGLTTEPCPSHNEAAVSQNRTRNHQSRAWHSPVPKELLKNISFNEENKGRLFFNERDKKLNISLMRIIKAAPLSPF